MDRRRPAISRQQRGVHVDQPEARRVEDDLREDLAVGSDDAEVGAEARKRVERTPDPSGARGCSTGSPAPSASSFTGACRLLPAPARAVRLRHDPDDLVARLEQRLERGRGKSGCAEENDRKRRRSYHSPARVSLLDLADDHVALDPAEPVDEQRARPDDPSRAGRLARADPCPRRSAPARGDRGLGRLRARGAPPWR